MTKKFYQLYNEIIEKEQFKKGSKFRKEVLKTFKGSDWKKSYPDTRELFKKLGGGSFKQQLVFDAKNYVANKINLSAVDNKIIDFLKHLGYQTSDVSYASGICFKGDKAYNIKQILNEYTSKLTNMQKFDDRIDEIKILEEKLKKQGKQLPEDQKKRLEAITKQKEAINKFQEVKNAIDKSNIGSLDGWKIVFQLSPRAIASQSTGVSWQSCQNLDSGVYRQYVGSGISAGTFIAWLIKAGDNVTEKDLKSPAARVLIKPMKKGKETFYYVDRIYPHGSPYSFLRTAVTKILHGHNINVSSGDYNLKKGIYQDTEAKIKMTDAFKYYHNGDFSDLDEKPEEFKVEVLKHYFNDFFNDEE